MSKEVSNYLVSWFITYLRDIQPTYIMLYRGYNPRTSQYAVHWFRNPARQAVEIDTLMGTNISPTSLHFSIKMIFLFQRYDMYGYSSCLEGKKIIKLNTKKWNSHYQLASWISFLLMNSTTRANVSVFKQRIMANWRDVWASLEPDSSIGSLVSIVSQRIYHCFLVGIITPPCDNQLQLGNMFCFIGFL